ncbi:MAG: efflux RND transporter permease subunit, partial [Oligoflexus sp.]
MQALFKFFVDNWRFSLILTVMLAISGVFGLMSLQREAFPPVNFARVQVTTIYPGASPEEVEERVTNAIEDELRGIEGVKDVRSTSQSERSEIDIRVDIDREDSEAVVSDIQRAVQRASGQLPPEVLDAPRVLEIKAREIPVVELAVIGSNEGRARDRLADALKRRLEDVRGVSAARLAGYTEKELQILLDPAKMERNYVGISEVMQAVAANLKNIPAGYLRNDESLQLVRVIGQAQTAEQLGEIVVRTNLDGQVIRIRDLGRTLEGAEEPTVLGRFNGEPATFLIATKKADIDALSVVAGIQTAIREFQVDLPAAYSLKVYNDEGVRVQNRLDIVSNNALSGMAIVLLILFLFLPGKIGLLSALSLPICTFGTVALMVYWGATFNIITMLALIICLGNLVDNSVVVSEQYSRLREQGVPAQEAAVRSAQQFWVPFTASTVTIIAAFLPMLVTKGVLGEFIQWIPVVVTAALLVSLVEALTLLPARLQFVSPKVKQGKDGKGGGWFDKIEQAFSRFFDNALKYNIFTTLGLTSLLISGFVVTAKFNRFELFPAEGVEYYVARFEAP